MPPRFWLARAHKMLATITLVALVSLSVPAPATAAVNVFSNPDLESVDGAAPSGWMSTFWGTPTPTFSYPVAGHTGNGAQVTFAANSNGDARWQTSAPLPVTAGQTYSYSNWYKSNVATEVNVEYRTSNGTLSYGWIASLPSSNNAWAEASAQVTIPANVTSATFYQILDKAGTLVVDDFLLSDGSTPTPTQPTLTFSASPTSVTAGQSSNLSWTSQNADSCTASGGWTGAKAVSGNESVVVNATTTYTLTCTGAGGNVSKSVTVNAGSVPTPTQPTLTFTASPTSITSGQSSTLTWSSQNATSCTATGGWSGGKALSGSQNVTPTTNTTYTLTCNGAGGSIVKSATVTVTTTPPPPGAFSEGMVTISFDDAWLSQYTNALPILETAGIKGTFYLTSEPIQKQWDGFMTTTQVKDLANKGHEIAGHTVTHVSLSGLTNTRIDKEIKDSKTYIQNLTGKPVTSLAYPYGNYNTKVINRLKAAGYSSARTVEDETLNTKTTNKHALKGLIPEQNTPTSLIKAEIDKARNNKQWLVIGFHEIDNSGMQYSNTPAQLQEIVNYIKANNVKTVTVAQGTALMQ